MQNSFEKERVWLEQVRLLGVLLNLFLDVNHTIWFWLRLLVLLKDLHNAAAVNPAQLLHNKTLNLLKVVL